MTDKHKHGTAGWDKRQRVHRHNGFTGSAKMMQAQLNAIIRADSTSERTKYLARIILEDYLELLLESLKERIDP